MIILPIQQVRADYKKADLVFHNVLHTHDSYEVQVFLSHPNANNNIPTVREGIYAGSLFFYGQGYSVEEQRRQISNREIIGNDYDLSPGASNISPFTLYIDITDKLHQFIGDSDIVISFATVDLKGHKLANPDFQFGYITLEVD
ncbi:hypothetical protein H6G76_03915 [Nostoc sp. FACHB-152]|uniref:hypothetical protein n=1 Tax=unclassified Nostoc TaxID=2593658 RepID=UPI001685D6B1|nr:MULTISPECIES: hypothetical protein [unclassified Nostoc]MBD2446319.1 hypothetical protein [Nostoc sp. FACHB-152]MBD2467619.1 hypothetical protein [Nostoc sp. FACHB-145]